MQVTNFEGCSAVTVIPRYDSSGEKECESKQAWSKLITLLKHISPISKHRNQ